MYYADIVVNQLKQKGFYDDVGQFDVTDQVIRQHIGVTSILKLPRSKNMKN